MRWFWVEIFADRDGTEFIAGEWVRAFTRADAYHLSGVRDDKPYEVWDATLDSEMTPRQRDRIDAMPVIGRQLSAA